MASSKKLDGRARRAEAERRLSHRTGDHQVRALRRTHRQRWVERLGAPSKGYRANRTRHRPRRDRTFPIPEAGVHLGRERGDILFPEDGCLGLPAASSTGGSCSPISEPNGTFLRITSEADVGDVLIGQQPPHRDVRRGLVNPSVRSASSPPSSRRRSIPDHAAAATAVLAMLWGPRRPRGRRRDGRALKRGAAPARRGNRRGQADFFVSHL
jgi:hypothetical protein